MKAVIEDRTGQRVAWLDYAKAIGIFLVVWGHTLKDTPTPTDAGMLVRQYIYAFHMPLFFLLSGVGLWYKLVQTSDITLREELKRRAEKLLPPYAFWSTVYSVLVILANLLRHRAPFHTMGNQMTSIVFGFISPVWFLYTLFMAEAAFLIIWKKCKAKGIDRLISTWGGVNTALCGGSGFAGSAV